MDERKLKRILAHDMMRPFEHTKLKVLENTDGLESLFVSPKPKRGHHMNFETKPDLVFPFAVWEAKKDGEGDPVMQNAMEVKNILHSQHRLSKRANIAWDPLAFQFCSMGSEWKLYACYAEKRSETEETESEDDERGSNETEGDANLADALKIVR